MWPWLPLISSASRYNEIDPEVVALIVIALAMVLLVISFIIVRSFEQLAEASRLKTEFVSIVSHQIQIAAYQFKMDCRDIDVGNIGKNRRQARRNISEILKENLERMQKLVSDLLTVSRIEATKFVLKKEEFSMENLVRDLISEFEPIAKSSNIKIEMERPPGLPKVYSDPFQVLQVLENLLYNAMRYMGFASEQRRRRAKAGQCAIKLFPREIMFIAKCRTTASAFPKTIKNIFSRSFSARKMCGAIKPAVRAWDFIFPKALLKDRAAKWVFPVAKGREPLFGSNCRWRQERFQDEKPEINLRLGFENNN